ncbi:MAG TPA: hypothetical protein VHX65_08955 [Pirellulales bacterium]|nr:hypothetical protein [Pirellulales bacterium]
MGNFLVAEATHLPMSDLSQLGVVEFGHQHPALIRHLGGEGRSRLSPFGSINSRSSLGIPWFLEERFAAHLSQIATEGEMSPPLSADFASRNDDQQFPQLGLVVQPRESASTSATNETLYRA